MLALMVIRKHVREGGTAVGPILLLSYKNHALEELLCDVLKFDPNIKPGAMVRCGKVESAELSDFSERNTKEERDAEQALQECIAIYRASRAMSKRFLEAVRTQGFGADTVLSAMRMLLLLQDSGYTNPEDGGYDADLLPELVRPGSTDLACKYSVGDFQEVFFSWIDEARHWREVFHGGVPEADVVPRLLVSWLRGQSPPPRCAAGECAQYAKAGSAFCLAHNCAAAACASRSDLARGFPFCAAHTCVHGAGGAQCKAQKHVLADYCGEHACPGCLQHAAMDGDHQVSPRGDFDACGNHQCKAPHCGGLIILPALYCVDHLCIQCVETGVFDGPPSRDDRSGLCAGHGCAIMHCTKPRLLSIDDTNFCADHLCRLCEDSVDMSSERAAQSLLCTMHRCGYDAYECLQEVLVLDDGTCSTCCLHHTCRICVEEGAVGDSAEVVADFPQNLCRRHFPPNAAEKKLEFTGTCHGVTKKGPPCKAKMPEKGLYCRAHLHQQVAEIKASRVSHEPSLLEESLRHCRAYCDDLHANETLCRPFALVKCGGDLCSVHGIREAAVPVGESWMCPAHAPVGTSVRIVAKRNAAPMEPAPAPEECASKKEAAVSRKSPTPSTAPAGTIMIVFAFKTCTYFRT